MTIFTKLYKAFQSRCKPKEINTEHCNNLQHLQIANTTFATNIYYLPATSLYYSYLCIYSCQKLYKYYLFL